MKKYMYKVHLGREPEGGFTVTVSALPGCVSWGEDYEHAVAMIQEAIEGYLEVLREKGKASPEEPLTTTTDTIVHVRSFAVA